MSTLHRRRFVAALAAAPWLTQAAQAALPSAPRVLSFAHLHTGERLELEYARGTDYLPDALTAVNRLLRDFRSGEVGAMDPALLDLLHALHGRLGSRRPFEIISGYRSPATNRMLHERSSGVASGSLHMSGRAIDVRLADVPLERLRDAALGLGGGGVGYYPGSNFVHVDTGRVRRW
ncbi:MULTISPECIES: DUF882 domain-containing protein [Piscinibacter]|uniref:DUF882 domain-containing protein n=1 Tax=Piscinibacter TaxID=1114981 RepID=UPI000FDCFD41|nr:MULTISPECIES: DUF882 domain-containing protein [Piscinibacter]